MSFPTTLDDFTPKVDAVDDIMAVDVNELQTALEALEVKVGVDGSAVAASIDYLLKNAASIDPGHLHTGSSIELLEIGNATYDDLQDFVNSVQSAGFIDGFTLSNSREVLELDVAAGSGIIKITNSAIGVTKFFDFAGVQNVTLTADNINYIYVDYNAGTPQIVATTDRSTIELNRHIILGRVYKNGTTLHILNSGVCVCNIIRKDHERLVERDGFDYISGAILSETGTLNIALTAGVWYMGLNRITTDALDTSVADTFEYKHYGTASWITDNASATAIDCTHYNDGDDVLGSLGVNNYGVQWVYITTNSKMWIIYGTENGTLANAEAATPPASIPTYIETMGELVAKIIVRQSGSIISILATQAETYSASAVSNHNELGGIQGGIANEYYHLTSARHTQLAAIADLSPSDDDVIQRKASAWVNRTMAQLKTDLVLVKADIGLGSVDNTSDATKDAATATLTNKTLTSPKINEAVVLTATATELNLLDGITVLSGSNTGDQTLPVKATGAELDTGTDDAKFATAKALADSKYVKRDETATVTNKRVNPRINTIASSATPTPVGDTTDEFTVTALAAGATFAAPTGTPVNGQKLIIRIKDNATARALAWNAIYRASSDLDLPTTTVASKTMILGFIYNSANSVWDFVAFLDNI